MKKIRLDKFISDCGYATRSQAKKLIKSRRVTVGGETVTDEAFKVAEDSEDIRVDGVLLKLEKFVYIMLNKPQGVISATEDPRHKTVIDLLSSELKKKELFPVGRLDIDTEGLLILTNDGAFAHNSLSPKKHVPKKYLVHAADYKFSGESRERFKRGLEIDGGYICKPADLAFIEETEEYTVVSVVISEGKFHQIKRMFAAEGGRVIYLKRLAFGGIELDGALKPGEYRPLNAAETEHITEITGERK